MSEIDLTIFLISIYAAVGYWKLHDGVQHLRNIDDALQRLCDKFAPDDDDDD